MWYDWYVLGTAYTILSTFLFLVICCNFNKEKKDRFESGYIPALALVFASFGLVYLYLHGTVIYSALTSGSQFERDHLIYRLTSDYAWIYYLELATVLPVLLFINPIRKNMYAMSIICIIAFLISTFFLCVQFGWL